MFWPPRTEEQDGGDETVDREERRGPRSDTDGWAIAVFSGSHFETKRTGMRGGWGLLQQVQRGGEVWGGWVGSVDSGEHQAKHGRAESLVTI